MRYYERNLGWTAIPDAFAGGTLWPIGATPQPKRCPAAEP